MVFVKHQVQNIGGTDYEYYYLYESYYEPSMSNPTNFKVGKVGDSISSLTDSFREKANDKGLDISESDIDHFKIQLRTVEEKAEQENVDDEDLGEFYQDIFNEENESEDEKPDPDDIDPWSLVESSYGEEPGMWKWSDKNRVVTFNEDNNSLYVNIGDSPSEKIKEVDSWEEAFEWLKDYDESELNRNLSDKDPMELSYVYKQAYDNFVPVSFNNSIPHEFLVNNYVAVEGKMVGSERPIPYELFEDYDLKLVEKNENRYEVGTLGLDEFVSKSSKSKTSLIDGIAEGEDEAVFRTISNELYENNLDNKFIDENVFDKIQDDVESMDNYRSGVDEFKVLIKGTDEVKEYGDNIKLRVNALVPGSDMPSDKLDRHDFLKTINEKYHIDSAVNYVDLDSGETREIGVIGYKDGKFIDPDIDERLVDSHLPLVEDMEVHKVVENMEVIGRDKEIKRKFAKNVLNIAKRNNVTKDNKGNRRIWKHLVVQSGSNDVYASVRTVTNNILSITLNVKKYKNAPEEKKREIEAHEAVHFAKGNHYTSFYEQLIEVIGSEHGSLDDYRRFIATDIRASTDNLEPEKIIPGFSEEVFDWELKKIASKITQMMESLDSYSDNERFSEYNNVAWEEIGSKVAFRLGRGRGKRRLEIATVNRLTGDIEVKEPELWVYISKVDLTDGTVEFEEASRNFQEAFEDFKYGSRNVGDLRTYYWNRDSNERRPLAKKIKKSMRSYFNSFEGSKKKFDVKEQDVLDKTIVRQMTNGDENIPVLQVKEGNIVVEKGIDSRGVIPIAISQENGDIEEYEVTGSKGIKEFIQMLEDGEDVVEKAKDSDRRWNEYSGSKPGDISVIGIRDDEKEKYYSMINSVKARVPDEKFDQLEEIKFSSNLKGRGSRAIGTYRNGVIKIDKNKSTLVQYYVIAHEIGHLIEDDTDNPGRERLMGKKYLRSGTSYVLKDEDREVLDPFKERIDEVDLSVLPEQGQKQLNWLTAPSRKYGKREQSKNNYNYKEVFARAFAVWIVNKDEFKNLFPEMNEYMEDFVENRDSWSEEYGVDL